MTTDAVPGSGPYAGFWRRVLAFIVDLIVLGVAGGVINFALTLILAAFGFTIDPKTINTPEGKRMLVHFFLLLGGLAGAIGLIGQWLYFAILESSSLQATFGKLAVSARITDLGGQRIGFGRATGRYFAKYISAIVLMIGFIMAGFTTRKQALHDMIAGTLVMRTPD